MVYQVLSTHGLCRIIRSSLAYFCMKLTSLTNQEKALSILLAIASLGQFERFATVFGTVSIHEVLMVVFSSVALRFDRTLKKPLLWLCLAFFVWTLATTLINAWVLGSVALAKTGFAYLARLAIYGVFAFSLSSAIRRKKVRVHFLSHATLAWLLLIALIGAGQYLFLPDTRQFFWLGWDDHLNRAFGTIMDPGFFGLLMSVGAVQSINVWLSSKRRSSGFAIIFGIFLLMLTLSFSRASYVAFLAGVLVLAWVKSSRKVLLFIPVLIMALVLVPKDGGGEGQKLTRTNSVEARIEVAEYHTEKLSIRDLLIGRGWYYESALQLHRQGIESLTGKTVKNALPAHSQAVDNSYLHVFLSTGVVGIILFSGIIFQVIKTFWKSPELAVIASVLAHSLFSTALFYPWVLLALTCLLIPKAVRQQTNRSF